MKVKAAPGVRVPKEGAPRQYIEESQGVIDVAESAYYLLRLREGDLIRCDDAVPAIPAATLIRQPATPDAMPAKAQ